MTRVGVADGDSDPRLPAVRRRADLAALARSAPAAEGGTYALVMLDAYLPPQRLRDGARRTSGSRLSSGRVPLPGRQTEIVRIPALRVPDDVVAGMDEVAARKEAGGRRLPGQGRRRRPATGWASGSCGSSTTAAPRWPPPRRPRTGTGCACVYAAVVRATPDGAARRRGPARMYGRSTPPPRCSRLDRTVFTPPLPEQRDVAGRRPTPAPSPAPTQSERPRRDQRTGAVAPVGESSEPAPAVTTVTRPSKPEPTGRCRRATTRRTPPRGRRPPCRRR